MSIKYKWLAHSLEEWIDKNKHLGVDKLPTESELCNKYHVSRQTVRQALKLLEEKSLIIKKRGSGSYLTGLSQSPSENTIGILLNNTEEYLYPSLLHDIHTTLYQHGYSYQVFETKNRTYNEREFLLSLLAHPLRGLIVEGCKTALPNPNHDLYAKLKKQGTHLLFLHNHYPALPDSIYLKDDNIQGSNLLVEHLVELGHTAIGGIFHAEDLQGVERFQGFMEAMRDHHLAVPDHRIAWFRTSDIERLEKKHDTSFLKKIVQNSFQSCTAIVCYNDEIAYWLIKVLKSEGYRLPMDYSVVSFDHSYLSNSSMLSITSLAHKPHELGQKAALLMMDQCKGLPVISHIIPWTLVPQSSSVKPSSLNDTLLENTPESS